MLEDYNNKKISVASVEMLPEFSVTGPVNSGISVTNIDTESDADSDIVRGSNDSKSNTDTEGSDKGDSKAQQLVSYALQFVGNPYVYGGTSLTKGCDCSGFVQAVYKKYGYSLPRTTGQMRAMSGKTENISTSDTSKWKKGDLLLFADKTNENNCHHVALYIGNGKMVHAANSRLGIITSTVSSWISGNDMICCVKRIII